ncbi:MAG: hypothetical protein EOO23_02200 [Comamonadaceae bacterium]|nr:MAG: hypothetical protein EOO23_02200 [Comamonadaceae bacterium]
MLRVIDFVDDGVEPWKNGLGPTEIMAEERLPGPSAKGWSGLVWRLNRTVVAAALPFSDRHGYDRFQVVTMGFGLYFDLNWARCRRYSRRLF